MSVASPAGTPRSTASQDSQGDVPNIKSLLRLKKRYEPPADETLSPSYRSNSEKELLWLWCARNMVRQLKVKQSSEHMRMDFRHSQKKCICI